MTDDERRLFLSRKNAGRDKIDHLNARLEDLGLEGLSDCLLKLEFSDPIRQEAFNLCSDCMARGEHKRVLWDSKEALDIATQKEAARLDDSLATAFLLESEYTGALQSSMADLLSNALLLVSVYDEGVYLFDNTLTSWLIVDVDVDHSPCHYETISWGKKWQHLA